MSMKIMVSILFVQLFSYLMPPGLSSTPHHVEDEVSERPSVFIPPCYILIISILEEGLLRWSERSSENSIHWIPHTGFLLRQDFIDAVTHSSSSYHLWHLPLLLSLHPTAISGWLYPRFLHLTQNEQQ